MSFPTSQVLNNDNLAFTLTSSINNGRAGAFIDGTDRYVVAVDWDAFKLHVGKTTDYGTTWTDCDTANAPSVANNSGAPQPRQFEIFCACQDTANRKLYIAFWSTAFTIAIISFDCVTGLFGTVHDSGFDYGATTFLTDPDLSCEYRPSDDSVWVLYTHMDGDPTIEGQHVFGFKFSCAGSTFGGNAIRIGVVGDRKQWRLGASILDPVSDKIRVIGTIDHEPNPNPVTAKLWYVTISTADSFSAALDVASGGAGGYDLTSYPAIVGGVIGFTYLVGSQGIGIGTTHVVRATVADAPVWEDATPAAMQLPSASAGSYGLMKFGIDDAGVHYVFYGYPTAAGANERYASISSAGLGLAWDAVETVVANLTQDADVSSNNLITGTFGTNGVIIVFGYTPDFGNFGLGYFEDAAAPPPAPPLSLVRLNQMQIQPVILPDPRVWCKRSTQEKCTPKSRAKAFPFDSNSKVITYVSH